MNRILGQMFKLMTISGKPSHMVLLSMNHRIGIYVLVQSSFLAPSLGQKIRNDFPVATQLFRGRCLTQTYQSYFFPLVLSIYDIYHV